MENLISACFEDIKCKFDEVCNRLNSDESGLSTTSVRCCEIRSSEATLNTKPDDVDRNPAARNLSDSEGLILYIVLRKEKVKSSSNPSSPSRRNDTPPKMRRTQSADPFMRSPVPFDNHQFNRENQKHCITRRLKCTHSR